MAVTWRLIIDPESAGSWNMALDEALLQSVAAKESPPALRLYGWNPATLSLGYAQPFSDVDEERLQVENWGLVRRPTGGRGILHVDELTYSVTAPLDDPILAGSLLESYRKISAALVCALELIGIKVEADRQYDLGDSKMINPVCFETPSNYEITFEGKKLIGSAQARKYNGLLQHGALPIFGDLTRITRVLRFNDDGERAVAAKRVLKRATTIEAILGRIIPFQQVAEAFVEGFSKTLEITFEPSTPQESEISQARELEKQKYRSDDWTKRL